MEGDRYAWAIKTYPDLNTLSDNKLKNEKYKAALDMDQSKVAAIKAILEFRDVISNEKFNI